MNIKSKTYMQGGEFKERQSAFGFFCAQAFEFIKQFAEDCRAGWKAIFKAASQKFENRTLDLTLATLTHKEWKKRKTQVYLKLVNA